MKKPLAKKIVDALKEEFPNLQRGGWDDSQAKAVVQSVIDEHDDPLDDEDDDFQSEVDFDEDDELEGEVQWNGGRQ